MNIHSPQMNAAAAIDRLKPQFGDRLSTALIVREQHGQDLTWNKGAAPDAVVFVRSTSEVQTVVKTCAELRVPIIAYGTGTSLEGHITAPYGGITVSMRDMTAILEVNASDLDCRVQAGVQRKALNADLRDQGLFFPIDPGADASIGGMTATRASGTNAVRYGTMKDNVLGLTVVMADGSIIHTGSRAKKSSAGYDLTRLMVGSEGTLGIITEVQLKLHGIPQAMRAGVCAMPNVEACCLTAIETIQMGIPISRIELVDAESIRGINAYSKLTLPEQPMLFLEFAGTDASVAEQVHLFTDIAAGHGGGAISWAEHEEDRARLWQARHDAFWAAQAMVKPGLGSISTDICVPISRLAECVAQTRLDLQSEGIYCPMIGHIGDGNFHVALFCDRENSEDVARIKAAYSRLVTRALAMGGTCTGEHGIGSGKRQYLEREHGDSLAVMRSIKHALDPCNIMNPGKNAGP